MKPDTLTTQERIVFELRELYQSYGYRPYKVGKFEEYDLYMITVSADAHRVQDVNFQFAESEALARACGATELWQFNGKGFEPIPIGG